MAAVVSEISVSEPGPNPRDGSIRFQYCEMKEIVQVTAARMITVTGVLVGSFQKLKF